MAQMARDLK